MHVQVVAPAQCLVAPRHLVRAQRLAMRSLVPWSVWSAEPKIVLQQISDGSIARRAAALDRAVQPRRHRVRRPWAPRASRSRQSGSGVVVGEPAAHLPVDRNAVVVRRKTMSFPSPSVPASEHASWDTPSIRQPSPAEGVGVVIDDIEARTVELRAEQPFRERHTGRRW